MKCNYYIAMKCIYNRVEAKREIPKLKFAIKQSVETAIYEI